MALFAAGLPGERTPVASVRKRQLISVVGRRVAELRLQRGMTQEELADRLKVTDRYLRRIESGEINLTLGWLARLANALEVSVVDLLSTASP